MTTETTTDLAEKDLAARAAELLAEHRASIDRLDAILVYTLGERFKHTQAVGLLKATHDLPPSDPSREAAQIARLEGDPGGSRSRFRQGFSEVHHQRSHPAPPETPGIRGLRPRP